MEELCHNGIKPATLDVAKTAMHKFKSYRCGKDTWLDACSSSNCDADDATLFMSSAGRVDNHSFEKIKGHIAVGVYDPSVPAVNIFAGAGCTGASARLYSSTVPEKRTVEYS